MRREELDSEEMLRLLLDFCGVNTVNGEEGCENNGTQFLYESLKTIPYFQENPDCLFLQPVEGDPLKRKNLVAFLKANPPTKNTIILSGHIDTVDTEVCGPLKDLAFQPVKYTEALLKADIDDEIWKELQSGEYLAGRGVADMKSGLAAQWAILKYYAMHLEKLKVNLLWIPVIDEENNANGIHQAVEYFCSLRNEKYELLCCIDSEPTITPESKDCGRIYLGTIGMVTPFALAVGKESHVGEYFEGISAALMAFHLGIAMENNPEFTEIYKGKKYPPICCLRTMDFRKSYSVTVPNRFAMYFNYLFVRKRPGDILNLVSLFASSSAEKALEQAGKGKRKVKILTFEELCTEYEQKTGRSHEESLQEYIRRCLRDMDIQDCCMSFVNELCDEIQLEGPAFVIGFLPPYCPSRVNLRISEKERKVESIAEKLIDTRKNKGLDIRLSEVYEGISDLSELGFQGDGRDIHLLQKNLVGLNVGTPYPLEKMQQLDIPVINIGPVGKDAHKMGERLYLPYFKDVLPGLLLDFIEEMQR
ncbi:M20/M25/M40 family metallo-hydrolase [Caproiciproducens galactitolivorans]|uniref:M20/M25/M40 family metallo-hydrolase n=1 Tax=Caproiciproducens galactitolivorans TaxID=642589 RepID=A0ABT4BS79_9FIRM|nr:M20/M25/M40 family metallo-hydrolase [Caproiciproducens galactitolivorans]MCY1712958.1 M20/M25/M40 family metallo-hydrolase [Caproiciproducens galactitolivorans]